ncbi:MAG: hypothetical protein LM564_00200 [Desulfurococcaceae archaeon]|nr:hypothetical protein [Desulfurococcaceae archaeon]
MADCEIYLKVLGRLDDFARVLGARDFEEVLQFPFADFVKVFNVSAELYRFILVMALLTNEILACREK